MIGHCKNYWSQHLAWEFGITLQFETNTGDWPHDSKYWWRDIKGPLTTPSSKASMRFLAHLRYRLHWCSFLCTSLNDMRTLLWDRTSRWRFFLVWKHHLLPVAMTLLFGCMRLSLHTHCKTCYTMWNQLIAHNRQARRRGRLGMQLPSKSMLADRSELTSLTEEPIDSFCLSGIMCVTLLASWLVKKGEEKPEEKDTSF